MKADQLKRNGNTMNRNLNAIARKNRCKLLTAFNYHYQETEANCAYLLTQHALKRGWIQPRKPLSGANLIKLANQTTPPVQVWIAKAAAELALEAGYIPRSNEEWTTLVYTWAEIHGEFTDPDQAQTLFPEYLRENEALPLAIRAALEP